MPRNPGTGIYTKPSPDVVAGTTVESKVYNDFVNDVALDLNRARPIIAGGTGGDDAAEARTNLQAEVAMQFVADYNTQPWETGSFKSDVGSLNSPDGAGAAVNVYGGTVQVFSTQAAVVEARNLTTGTMYMRKKVAGVWSGWSADSGVGTFVLKAGDTMTGNLTLPSTPPAAADAVRKDYVDSTKVAKAGDTMTGMLTTVGSTGIMSVASPPAVRPIDVVGAGGAHAAYLAFVRPSVFGGLFGLDGDNQLKWGGWGLGANAYKILHEGNSPSSIAAGGYFKLPSGLMFVMGTMNLTGDDWVTFAVAFPTTCIGVVVSATVPSPLTASQALCYTSSSLSAAAFYCQQRYIASGGVVSSAGSPARYVAWGY